MASVPNGSAQKQIRCAIYTRKSTDEGLNQDFNSLDAQREAAEAYIHSQAGEGWLAQPELCDDGGYKGRKHGAARPEAAAGRLSGSPGGLRSRVQGGPAQPVDP